MTLHFHRELELLKKRLLSLAALVEESVQQSVRALEKNDCDLAQKVVDSDDRVNTLEVELEEECLKALALYQPVASDLRYIIAILKMNNDLERISDLAAALSRRALSLCEKKHVTCPYDLRKMAEETQQMLEFALDSLVNKDVILAKKVMAMDDEIDRRHAENFDKVKEAIQEAPEHIHQHMSYLTVSRHLERIADLATNIAEDIIYMIQGDIVRHTIA